MKKPALLFKIVLIAIVMAFSASCKNKNCKKDGSCPPEYYRIQISEEAKSYLWAKEGSYWIYKNSATGDIDTQTCVSFSFDTVTIKGSSPSSKHVTVEDDILERFIYSSFNEIYYHDRTFSHNPDYESFKSGTIVLERNGSGSITPFFYPFDKHLVSGNGSSRTNTIGMDSSLTIQGQTYKNVIKFNIDMDNIWDNKLNCKGSNNVYFWAKDVGLIKKEMKTCNTSWEIIDYKIIK